MERVAYKLENCMTIECHKDKRNDNETNYVVRCGGSSDGRELLNELTQEFNKLGIHYDTAAYYVIIFIFDDKDSNLVKQTISGFCAKHEFEQLNFDDDESADSESSK